MFERTFKLGKREVGAGHPPFVIAEMSGNHKGSLERALGIVDAAAEAGVDALKIQTYTADTMTLDIREKDFFISDPSSPWAGRSLYELYAEASTPWEWHEAIFERCKKKGILGFSTPFDGTAVDLLEKLGVPFYKVASFENIDIPLIRRVASTGKPVIISTGMATLEEIEDAVEAVRKSGNKKLALLKCTSSYPAEAADANLSTMADLSRRFGCPVGISDHTLGLGVSVCAVALGASFIEKHLTLRRDEGGVDAAFSMEPAEMKQLVEESRKAAKAAGEVRYGPLEIEKKSLCFRRSLYVVRDIRAGETFTSENVRSIRPGYGLAPKHYESLLGKKAAKDIRKGTALSRELIR